MITDLETYCLHIPCSNPSACSNPSGRLDEDTFELTLRCDEIVTSQPAGLNSTYRRSSYAFPSVFKVSGMQV